jgi:hypothetical protein
MSWSDHFERFDNFVELVGVGKRNSGPTLETEGGAVSDKNVMGDESLTQTGTLNDQPVGRRVEDFEAEN